MPPTGFEPVLRA